MGESQGALPRHRTLRAAIDWSYNLLSEAERSLFRRLSVFAGGWALSAAEEVCRDGLRTEEIVILLTRLVNKSLVVVEKHDGESRYRLLETIRQYATDKLLGSGEAPSLRQRHLNWFLDLAERAEPELKRPDQRAWLDGLEVEHENLRAALGWSLENSETDAGANGRSSLLRLAGAMWRFWYVRSYLTEGRGWLEKALAEAEGEVSPVRAKALIGAGFLTWRQDDYGRATAFFEESLSSFRELGDKWGMAESLRGLGFVARDQGDYKRATAFFEESLALFREVGDRGGIAWPLNDLGVVSMNQGHYTRATELCQESLSLFRELGDRWGAAVSLNVLGLVAVRQGDYNRAKVLCGDSLSIFRELGDKRGIAWCLTGLAGASEAQGELGQARAWHEEGLAIYRELGHKRGIAWALGTVGAIARRQGDHERARAFLEESFLLYQVLEDKSGIAWCLEGLAIIARARGEAELSALMFGKAEALREEAGVPLPAPYQAEYDLNLASLLAKLGEEELRAVWEEGRGMTVEQVIDAYKQNISSSPSP
jgi:tetratricopeptide (TPR) repeat protein